jgi:succinate dehydrogenase / fumarate reductase cytochrome b subunit
VVKKVIMAVTGLIMICFLLMHMFGNLKVFISSPGNPGEAFNHYAEWLKQDILYPILPHGWFIWIFRAVLVASVVLHIYCALKVWQASVQGRGSREGKKYTRVNRPEQTWSVRIMRWGGVTLGLLLILHLLMFTTKSVRFGAFETDTAPYRMFINTFSAERWYIGVIYLVFMLAVCFHVRHGFYSAFTTLGANISPRARGILNGLAYFVATLIFVGFALPVTASILGFVGGA